ncbi:hypothetical protein JCM10450v2_004825 [Rhodotorula kratochvilovae]
MAAQLSPAQLQALMARLSSSSSGTAPPALDAFLALSPDERAGAAGLGTVAQLLQALSQGFDPAPEQRRKLVAAVLAAAPLALDGAPGPTIGPLCTLLKLLGRSAAGTEELARADGLRTLLALGGLARVAELPRAATPSAEEEDDDDDDGAAAERALAAFEVDPLQPAQQEALRCLGNTLTLHPSARELFPDVLLADERRGALRGLVRVLGCKGAGFLAGRLLFLLTSRPSELVGELALEGECVEAMQQFADRYLAIYRSASRRSALTSTTPGTPSLDDILREHLKLAYNLMLQYSRAPPAVPEGFNKAPGAGLGATVGKKRFWRSREKSGGSATSSPDVVAPADEAEAGTSSPRSKSPLSFARKVVGAVKGSSSAGSSPTLSTSPKEGGSPSLTAAAQPSGLVPAAAASSSAAGDSLTLTASHLFLPLFHPYLSLAVTLALLAPAPASPLAPAAEPSFKDPSPVVRAALNTLLNFPVELEELSGWSTSWLQYVPPRISPADGTVLKGGGIGSLGERLLELLRGVCDFHFPADRLPPAPKMHTARDREQGRQLEAPCAPDEWLPTGEGETGRVDEILGPVMLLLRKLSMLGEAQYVFRQLLFPDNLDRTTPIDRQPTLAGHLVRLLSSVLLPNTAFGAGEFLYNLCDRSPEVLVRTIGYGCAAGFLQNRGELIPPPASVAEGAVNPITGAVDAPPRAGAEEPDAMSEEEKEREAERLYTLFDRLARTGVVSAQNPVDAARAAGRFEETSEDREAELERARREEEELEREVERDMREWKERRRRAAEQGKDPAQV